MGKALAYRMLEDRDEGSKVNTMAKCFNMGMRSVLLRLVDAA